MAKLGCAVSTAAATRLVYTIGVVKWVALALIALGVLGGTVLGLSSGDFGGAISAFVWAYGAVAALGVYVFIGLAAADTAHAGRDRQEHREGRLAQPSVALLEVNSAMTGGTEGHPCAPSGDVRQRTVSGCATPERADRGHVRTLADERW